MIAGFDLNDWIQIWTKRYSPKAEYGYKNLDLDNRFAAAMRFIDSDDEYSRKIFGESIERETPEGLSIFRAVLDMGLADIWDDLTLENKGRYIAVYRINNMVKILERHAEIQRKVNEGDG